MCVIGLALGLAWMHAENQKKDTELAALREESQQLQQLRAEVEQAKASQTQADSEELVSLRKDKEELLRLRNEVSRLRGDKQRLTTQLQTVEAQAQGAQAQVQAMRTTSAQPANAAQQNPALAAALAARAGHPAANTEQAQTSICINNLRMIDGAKQQWALQKQKPPGALLTAADLAPFLRSNTVPTCPAGGVYTLNPVGVAPICNIPGHSISR
jgi:hypothetical protein